MHEAMARYQSRYGLKPVGPHRRMADELFESASVECEACQGRGLHDAGASADYEICPTCSGFGWFFARSHEEIQQLRQRILDAFPDAAADPVPSFPAAPLALNLTSGQIVDLASEQSDDTEDSGDEHHEPQESEPAEEDPWSKTSVTDIIATLDRGLIEDLDADPFGHIFKPSGELSIGSVLLALAPGIEDPFYSETPAEVFSRVAGVSPKAVVWCSVSDSMVSGSWGLVEFRLGSRGYLYYQPDWGVGDDESLPILAAWEPAEDRELRRQCLLHVYAREWSERGLPPAMGQWATGQADFLQAAILRVLEEHPKAWQLVFDRLGDCPELREPPSSTIDDVVQRSGEHAERVREVIETAAAHGSQFAMRLAGTTSDSEESRIVVALLLHCIAKDPFLRDQREGNNE